MNAQMQEWSNNCNEADNVSMKYETWIPKWPEQEKFYRHGVTQ